MASYQGESESVMAPRYIEDDLQQLADLDNNIREYLERRAMLVRAIKDKNNQNLERLNISEDWFEGELKGRPVPARDMNERPY